MLYAVLNLLQSTVMVSGVIWKTSLAYSLSFYSLGLSVNHLMPLGPLFFSQRSAYAANIIAVTNGKLHTVSTHFFNDGIIIQHRIHLSALPASKKWNIHIRVLTLYLTL